MRKMAMGAVLALGATCVQAALLAAKPANVCAYLEGEGLAASSWRNEGGPSFACSSRFKPLGDGGAAPNNLSFSAEGSRLSADRIKLVLNVKDPASASGAHAELRKAASALSLRATGLPLPDDVADAITSGTKRSQAIGRSLVEVQRLDWPTGSGYELRVMFR